MKVTAVISTMGRYFTTLPMCISSIINQTVKPNELIIYDDGEQKDLREEGIYKNLFHHLQAAGISWQVKFSPRKGQVFNHQSSLRDSSGGLIWRLDDDNVADPRCLEYLLLSMGDPSIGAVGGLVLDPKGVQDNNPAASNKIEDIYLGLNVQWFRNTTPQEVDHLYSTFLYRKEAAKHGYHMGLSRVGHREETIFTYEMKRAGWKIVVNPQAITWHYREGSGGIRSFKDQSLWDHDEKIFSELMGDWGVRKDRYDKHIVLDSGIGDHIVFLKILPDLKKAYPNARLVISNCYPYLFDDHKDVVLTSIQDAKNLFGDIDQWNVYKWMWDRNWKQSLESAFRGLYKC
jgi:GT2 family glycosyltransferase